MGEALESMFRRGVISSKQMSRMAGTKPQKSKMASFEGKSKDEGKAHGKGRTEVSVDEINERAVQDKGGKFGTPSKGGRVAGAEAQVKTGEINNAAEQKPKFPKGDKIKASHGKRQVGIRGHAGKSSGGEYGGPNSRANG